jgi:hypothetical protein
VARIVVVSLFFVVIVLVLVIVSAAAAAIVVVVVSLYFVVIHGSLLPPMTGARVTLQTPHYLRRVRPISSKTVGTMEPRIDVDNNHVAWNVFNLVNDTVRSLQPPLTDPRVILHTPQRIISVTITNSKTVLETAVPRVKSDWNPAENCSEVAIGHGENAMNLWFVKELGQQVCPRYAESLV